VCKPQPHVVPLQVVGYVPFRPLGSSHFLPAPWQGDSSDVDYVPCAMTIKALRQSCAKAVDPLLPYPDSKLAWMYQYGMRYLAGIWQGDNFATAPEAIGRMTMTKSAGYPYYYDCQDKYEAFVRYGPEIQQNVKNVLAGQQMWLPFSLTLKDELRTADRVAAEKTRGFNASGVVHLQCSKQLFSRQNDKLVETMGRHPITIGVAVPGPQFVKTVLSLGNRRRCFFADGDGCDQRFNLGCARIIRDLRKAFLAEDYHAAVDILYDAVYAGDTITMGVVYRLLHNKSGWENTGHDNSLYFWLALAEAVSTLTGRDADEVLKLIVNGDDFALSIDDDNVGIRQVRDYLAQYQVLIAYDNAEPCWAQEVVFLSHHLRERFVRGHGDLLVAAGNYSKLMSSVNWVRVNNSFSFEECVLMHLLGLRIVVWPWEYEFLLLEARIDSYLGTIVQTPRIRDILGARISVAQITDLHFRWESRAFFDVDSTGAGLLERFNGISLCVTKIIQNNNKNGTCAYYQAGTSASRDSASQGPVREGQGSCSC